MKLRAISAACLVAAASFLTQAQTPWIHVYYQGGSDYKGAKMTEVLDVTFDEETGEMSINGQNDVITAPMGKFERFVIGSNVPRIDITTNLNYGQYKALIYGYDPEEGEEIYGTAPVTEIESKTVYLDGVLKFDGQGLYDDVEVPVKIRGRGNSTWGYSKKPYRLKFDEKVKFGPVHKAKNQVLLANYLDPAMLKNYTAFAFGKIIGMPYINRSLPVDIYLNGQYKGAYQLTEKVGINNGSVDLSKEDEPNSILFELDTCSADEDEHPFHDDSFGMPIKFADPDAPEDYYEREEWLDYWRDEFNALTEIVYNEDARMFDYIDLETAVRYLMVFDICCNQELNHPKSSYVHKTKGGKWEFGPCWDFDWAFGYQPTYNPNSWQTYKNPLIALGAWENKGGNEFYMNIITQPKFMKRFREVWDDFYQNHQQEFWADFEEYAASMEPQANLQGVTRYNYRDYWNNVKTLRDWIQGRFDFINEDEYCGLYDPNYSKW